MSKYCDGLWHSNFVMSHFLYNAEFIENYGYWEDDDKAGHAFIVKLFQEEDDSIEQQELIYETNSDYSMCRISLQTWLNGNCISDVYVKRDEAERLRKEMGA